MNIIFIGSVELSRKTLEQLVTLKADIVGVVTPKTAGFNADFADLAAVCRARNIPYLGIDGINEPAVIDWMRGLKPDIIFCFGFSQMLGREVLFLAPMGVVGFHPAALPQNRGRHPIVWALALGLKATASTFFFMDEGADSGDILSQVKVPIAYTDDAGSLYAKVTKAALRQIKDFLPLLKSGKYRRIKQDRCRANTWRKRNKEDGRIDFRMSSRAVYNLVRALAKPYVGAHVVYGGQEVKVWKAKEGKVKLPHIEPGKVLEVKNGQVLVKCAERGVWLVKHEFKQLPKVGEYLVCADTFHRI